MVDRKKRCEELLATYETAPIRKTLGMDLSFDRYEEALLDLPHLPGYEHAMGDTHGGIIAILLDTAGWFAAAVHYDGRVVTIEMQMRLLEPARREPLRARGRLLRAGKNFAMTEMEVRTATGRLVATGSGTYAVTGTTGKKLSERKES